MKMPSTVPDKQWGTQYIYVRFFPPTSTSSPLYFTLNKASTLGYFHRSTKHVSQLLGQETLLSQVFLAYLERLLKPPK